MKEFNPGKSFIFGLELTEPQSEYLRFIEQYPPAGFLLLGENYKDPGQLKKLVLILKAAAGDDCIIAVDQEPGRVQRFKRGFPVSKTPSEYIARKSTYEFRQWCSDTSLMLYDLGINMNLAPVVDLFSPAGSYPVLNGRSFGEKAETVIEYARILVEEHKKNGIMTCLKHFPGLGSARHDPHETLSISDQPSESFIDYHWLPYKVLTELGVDSIMTTHLLAPALDPVEPATYSKKITEHVRRTIGFPGILISDDLYMGGAGQPETIEKSVIRALEAGHDLLILSKDLNIQRMGAEAVKKRYEDDEFFGKIVSAHEKTVEKTLSRFRN